MDRRRTDRRLNAPTDMYVFDIQKFFDVLWRRRFLCLILFVVFFTPGLLYTILRPDVYRAVTTVMLENQSYNLTDFQDVLPSVQFNDMTIETQVKVLTSPRLAHLTIDKLQSKGAGETKKDKEDQKEESEAGNSIEELTKEQAAAEKEMDRVRDADAQQSKYEKLVTFLTNLNVTPQGKSRVIEIAYKSTDPILAAETVNTHAEQYMAFQVRTKREQIMALNNWVASQVSNLREDSQTKSQAIQDFRKEAGIVPGKNSQELIMQQITDLTKQLVPIETEKLELQARLDSINNAKSQEGVVEVIESGVISGLKSQLSAARQELQSLNGSMGPNHPTLVATKRRVSQIQSDLNREITNVRTSLNIRLEAVTSQEAMLRERLEELNSQIDSMRDKAVTLESLQAEETANRSLLENYLARYEEIKSQLDLNRADVHIVSAAEIPTMPTGTRRAVLFVLSAVMAALFSLVIVFLLELVDRGIEDEEDIKRVLNLKLLGVLPKQKNPLSDVAGRNRTAYMEEIKRIYLQLAAQKGPQSILITAANSGEGKSTTVVALGTYLSSIGSKVILVDANTSSPSLATLTEVRPQPGFAELMAGGGDYARCIQKDPTGRAIIPHGNLTAHPVDILSSDAFPRLMDQLKQQYDYVLIDCAPVLSTTDAEIISAHVDQVILVIEWAKTHKKHLKKIAESLRQFSRNVPSVILNKKTAD